MVSLATTSCDRCGARVLVLELVDEHRQRTGERVVVDPLPSLHGFYERVSLTEPLAVERDLRKPRWYRPHHEHCPPTSGGGS